MPINNNKGTIKKKIRRKPNYKHQHIDYDKAEDKGKPLFEWLFTSTKVDMYTPHIVH